MLARMFDPGGVWIDGAYLLKHPTVRDRYQRVAENCELIKSEICNRWPTFTSWQFARPKNKTSKQPKGVKLGADDIAFSDAILQVSSVALGLFEDDNAENVMLRLVDVLKGRHGQTGWFKVNWDWKHMNFTQYEEEALKELIVQ
jgi:hypothetical protein